MNSCMEKITFMSRFIIPRHSFMHLFGLLIIALIIQLGTGIIIQAIIMHGIHTQYTDTEATLIFP